MNAKALLAAFFSRRIALTSLVFSLLVFFLDVLITYQYEARRIDELSKSRFGVPITEEFGFFDILESANTNFFRLFIIAAVFVFITTISALHLIRVGIIQEGHRGWSRLSIASVLFASASNLLTVNTSYAHLTVAVGSLVLYIIGALLIIRAIRWILDGFKRANEV